MNWEIITCTRIRHPDGLVDSSVDDFTYNFKILIFNYKKTFEVPTWDDTESRNSISSLILWTRSISLPASSRLTTRNCFRHFIIDFSPRDSQLQLWKNRKQKRSWKFHLIDDWSCLWWSPRKRYSVDLVKWVTWNAPPTDSSNTQN